MPAEKKEMDDAKKEEIKFKFLTNVVSIKGDLSGKVCEIECIDTKLVKKEGEDRDFPINVEDSNYFMDIDFVIMAVGSEPEEGLVKNLGLEINKWGYIDVDENYKTSLDNVFAGGDLAGTKSTVAWAARTGREAAYKIAEFLN
jgi:glutamate synthase (NADPH/NADH) small chain